MEPIEKYHKSEQILRNLFQTGYQDVFEKSFHRRLGFYIIFSLWLLSMTCATATIFDNFYERNIKIISVGILLGTTQGGLVTLFMADLRHVVPILDYIYDIYKKNSKPKTKHYNTCKYYADLSRKIINIAIVFTAIGTLLLAASGIFESIINKELKPCILLYFPGVHNHSCYYLLALSIFNYMIVFISLCAGPPGDLLYFLLLVHFPMMSFLVQNHLKELNRSLSGPESSSSRVKSLILKYMLMHRTFNEHVQLLDQHFYRYRLAKYSASIGFMVVAIFIIVALDNNHILALGIISIGVVDIVTSCISGTIVDNASNNIWYALSTLNWYQLPSTELRNYLILLNYARKSQKLYVAGVKPLNMETCVVTFRAIYSYTMVLNTAY